MIDLYTKGILTIIAICLSILVIRDLNVSPATAQTGPQHVVVDQVDPYAFRNAIPVAVEQVNAVVPVHTR